MRASDLERFWVKVSVTDECWLWMAGMRDGYGWFRVGGATGRMCFAHRVAYELIVGEIPQGCVLHHDCENAACVNPAHLTPMSQGEHMRWHDVHARAARVRRALTHCKHGHEFTGANTYVGPSGKRSCRQCAHGYAVAYRRRVLQGVG